jgi:hypothetical protein
VYSSRSVMHLLLLLVVSVSITSQVKPPASESPSKQHRHARGNSGATEKENKNPPPDVTAIPSANNVPNCVVQQINPETMEERNEKKSQARLNRINVCITTAGVIGGWVALGLLIWQNVLTRRSANAAVLNAQAVINAERPWVLVNPKTKTDAPGQYIVGAFNAGRTPAIILDGHCSCDKHSADFVPPEDLNDPFDRPKRDLIVSEDSFPIREINPESLINQADREGGGTDPQIVFVYGKLRYWDTFTDRNAPAAKPYETWWCWQYDSTKKTFGRCANGYTRNT